MELPGGQLAKSLVLGLLRAYKWALSPMFPPSCRYVPTCCEYAMEAVERYGVLRGSWMALRRISRCHPFVKGGYDPVVRDPSACCARSGRAAGATQEIRFTT